MYYVLYVTYFPGQKKKKRKALIESSPITSPEGKVRPRRLKTAPPGGVRVLGSRSPGSDLSLQWPGDAVAHGQEVRGYVGGDSGWKVDQARVS